MGSLLEFENAAQRLGLPDLHHRRHDPVRRVEGDPRRLHDIDLALLHLGGTKFFGLSMVTMDPRQGAEAIRIVKPKTAIPIHYDDYSVFEWALGDTNHPPDVPTAGGGDERHVVRGVHRDGEACRARHRREDPSPR